jgi:hypothetical protein
MSQQQEYKTLTVNDGFIRGPEAGVTIQGKGVSVEIDIEMSIEAKTVTTVMDELQKYKRDFSQKTWSKIEKGSVGGSSSFFYGLFSIGAGGSYSWENSETHTEVQENTESQRVMQAMSSADTAKVRMLGLYK